MFACDDVAAVVCARGGYGCSHLLPHLDLGLLKSKPKILIGYSDITTLLTFLADEGLTVFHGPMASIDFARKDGVDLASWQTVLGGGELWAKFAAKDGVEIVRRGSAEGVFYGGCLSLLEASLGTPFEIETNGKILLLEDTGAHPYQIDRMLTHLRQAGKLEEVAALVLGHFGVAHEELHFALRSALEGLDVPIVCGLPAGHVKTGNLTLPVGVRCALKAAAGRVELRFEKAVRE
jgi:muramoyltetrapeptide carboxypeptidase